MAQFLISVFHEAGVQDAGTAYQDDAAMQEAFAKVGAFNQKLQDEGRFVFACGLMPPEQAVTVEPSGSSTPGPIDADARFVQGGFWIVEADDLDAATALAIEGSQACGQRLEVRQLQG